MPIALQTRLLRVLEEREVVRVGGTRPVPIDVRIICATHCNLETRINEGRFRADLFYRLSVLRLYLPPLRERPEDLAPLAEWCLKNALASLGVRPHANLHAEVNACAPLLSQYHWPGNVRELRNLMQRIALFLVAEPLQALTPNFVMRVAPELTGSSPNSMALPRPFDFRPPDTGETLTEILARFNGNRESAAKYLGISRTTLWRKLQQPR